MAKGMRLDGVVVITGASSGIGKATAVAFAGKGAKVVLAARSEQSLHDVAAQCIEAGGEALVVPTDVGDQQQVDDLVKAAIEHFGRIDVFVGNAGVFSYGRFEDTPAEAFDQVIRTNLLGQANGARAVLPVFRKQKAGALIIVASLYSKITSPYVSPYVSSKFGLLGLATVLREEVRDMKGISVSTVMPATFDTPIYQHAANYTGKNVHPLMPVSDPRRVAATIVKVAQKPKREVFVGRLQRGAAYAQALFPGLYERLSVPMMNTVAIRRGRTAASDGNLFVPDERNNATAGGWRLLGPKADLPAE